MQTLTEKRAALQKNMTCLIEMKKMLKWVGGFNPISTQRTRKHNQRLVVLQEGKVVLEQHLGRINELVGTDKLEWHFNRAKESR